MTIAEAPAAKSEMLIRKPVSDVFEALVNPKITSNFWFTKGSARLEEGKTVEWEWGQFGIKATIIVKEVKQDQRIVFQWPADEEGSSQKTVEISFDPKSDETTFVRVVETGFDAKSETLVQEIGGQTAGWMLVLSGLKAWLEYGIDLNLVADHKPE